MSEIIDVVIAGAGPAGTSAASLLKMAGFEVCIIEKGKFPRFVIGESLLPRCMDLLEEASLLLEVQRQGYLIKHGALFLKDSSSFDLEFSNQWNQGWPYTYQVPRGHFDKVLADATEKKGVPILYESLVKNVTFNDGQPLITVEDSEGRQKKINARFFLDTSGYGHLLPELLGLSIPSSLPTRQAIFGHIRGDIRPSGNDEGKIWIVSIHEDAWMWIIPFSNGITSIGAVGNPQFFQNIDGDLQAKLLHSISLNKEVAKRLATIEFVFPPNTIANYSASVKQLHGPGYAVLGHAAMFLDPIFSNGITVSLESSNRAAKLLIKQLKGDKVDWKKEYDNYILSGINVFKAYVEAWYDGSLHSVLYCPEKNELAMKQITSILSGYVWDTTNPLVRQPKKRLDSITDQINLRMTLQVQP